MPKINKYNFFIFFSSLARNIIEVFSSIMLYKLGFSIRYIYLFFVIYYFVGLIINYATIYLGNKITYNLVLIISSLIYAYTFYFISTMNNTIISLIIFSLLLSISSFSYHIIRHYYALRSLDTTDIRKIGNILIYNYLALILSSFFGSFINNNIILILIVIICSLISIIPLFFFKDKDNKIIKLEYKEIKKEQIKFFILEQSKVILLLIQPLYLYLAIDNSIKFVGIFNIIINIISILFLYYLIRKIKLKYFKYINIFFAILLFFKINIYNTNILMVIAVFEAMGIKTFELFSNNNLYNISNINSKGYVLIAELIFNLTKLIIFTFFFIFNFNLKLLLYLCILGILLCSFVYKNMKYTN